MLKQAAVLKQAGIMIRFIIYTKKAIPSTFRITALMIYIDLFRMKCS